MWGNIFTGSGESDKDILGRLFSAYHRGQLYKKSFIRSLSLGNLTCFSKVIVTCPSSNYLSLPNLCCYNLQVSFFFQGTMQPIFFKDSCLLGLLIICFFARHKCDFKSPLTSHELGKACLPGHLVHGYPRAERPGYSNTHWFCAWPFAVYCLPPSRPQGVGVYSLNKMIFHSSGRL